MSKDPPEAAHQHPERERSSLALPPPSIPRPSPPRPSPPRLSPPSTPPPPPPPPPPPLSLSLSLVLSLSRSLAQKRPERERPADQPDARNKKGSPPLVQPNNTLQCPALPCPYQPHPYPTLPGGTHHPACQHTSLPLGPLSLLLSLPSVGMNTVSGAGHRRKRGRKDGGGGDTRTGGVPSEE